MSADTTQQTGEPTGPRQTPLHSVHSALGASFTDFGGWDMPLKYGSELAEHRAVRDAAGIFDLSHMGEVRVTGAEAAAFLDFALLATYSTMKVGKAKYGVIVDESAGIIDDLITYRMADEEYLVVPNASNTPAVAAALAERAEQFRSAGTADAGSVDLEVRDESGDTALIAVQGPAAEAILLATQDDAGARAGIEDLKYYAWAPLTVSGIDVMLARTGYTGEDGFELYLPNPQAVSLWEALTAAGEGHGLVPAGLAARDSLRLEAGMPLYGNELSRQTTPIDAGLGRMVTAALKNKSEFWARAALEQLAGTEPARVLAGLTSEGRRAARAGSAVSVDGKEVGTVTSGQPSPTLGHPIALAYLDSVAAEPGTAVSVDIRGKAHDFTVTALPFYSRQQD